MWTRPAQHHVTGKILLVICGERKVPISIVAALQSSRPIGIFAAGGNFEADFNLLLQLAMRVALIVGAVSTSRPHVLA
jgi:hypothetical protein